MSQRNTHCSVCEEPLPPTNSPLCERCKGITTETNVDRVIDRMRSAGREHRRLVAIAMTLLACHPDEAQP